ncbi:MAG: ABC transporter ATP-binding protein [Solirubrobacterales bacterium]
MTAMVQADGVGRRFGELEVLEGIDFGLDEGEVLSVIGPSGCGKSTLLRLIAGLDRPTTGTITVGGGPDLDDRLARCAYMPQEDCLLPWFSALDNAALALRNRGGSRREAREEARPVFERLGLGGFEDSRPTELSGGMRQRVAFARTWLAGKSVLLLDEPLAALDGLTRRSMQAWFAPLLAGGEHSAVLVTHDLDEALYLGDRVMVLSERPGRVLGLRKAPGRGGMEPIEASGSLTFIEARNELAALLESSSPGFQMKEAQP